MTTTAESHALMQRELDAQPELIPQIAEALVAEAAGIRPEPGQPLWVGGCGDSLFAGQAIALHARRLGHDLRPVSAAEMLWEAPIGPEAMVVGVSISGSTRRTVEALKAAREKGARTIAVTLNPDSALGQVAHDTLRLPYTPISRAIPHGLDYHVTLMALAALLGPVPAADLGRHAQTATPGYLSQGQALAETMDADARLVFLGGGAALGSAAFGAAKLHEAGGLPAWAYEAENFAHGALFVLRKGDLVVLCGAGGAADARTWDMADGLRALGLSVMTCGQGADLPPLLAALDCGIASQALCLAVAQERGLNVTDPAQGSGADAVQKQFFAWTADR